MRHQTFHLCHYCPWQKQQYCHWYENGLVQLLNYINGLCIALLSTALSGSWYGSSLVCHIDKSFSDCVERGTKRGLGGSSRAVGDRDGLQLLRCRVFPHPAFRIEEQFEQPLFVLTID